MSLTPSLDDLHSLLTSGIACLRQGISLIEVVHHSDWCAADPVSTEDVEELRQHELGRVLYANPALEEMTGLTMTELQAGGLGAILGPASNPADMAALRAALHCNTATTIRCMCYKRDGGPGSSSASWSSSISITPINQLPWMTAAWMPAQSPPSASGTTSRNSLCSNGSEPPPGYLLNRSSSQLQSVQQDTSASSHDQQNGDALAAAMFRLAQPPQQSAISSRPVDSRGDSGLAANGSVRACRRPTTVQYLCCHEDISARMSEEMSWRLRDHALSSCSEGITIADPSQPDAPLIYVNDAFLQITGYTREDVMGRNCRFLQGDETSRDAVATLKAAVAARRKATVELLNYKKTGEAFWNRLSITPVLNEVGDLVSYIGVQSDVTELIRRKEEERKLMAAKIAAETAMEAKSMFLANMSHEIRTPLNGMMATAQLLLASCLTPEQRELAETILESGNSLLGILGDILDFSKLDQGSISLNHEPICLRRSIEACIEIVAPDALKKGLSLYYTCDDESVSHLLMGDAIRLRQVLTNLLSNAVKFTEKGEVHVDVCVEPLPARQPCCCQENGCNQQCSARALPVHVPAACSMLADKLMGGKAGAGRSTSGPTSSILEEEEQAWAEAVIRRKSLEDSPTTGSSRQSAAAPEAAGLQLGCGRRVRISVRDTGIGIPVDIASSLFQCFKQGSETMARRYGGTGLGLAICKRLSDLMQGTVWVESAGPDKGCTFHFCVPADFQNPSQQGPATPNTADYFSNLRTDSVPAASVHLDSPSETPRAPGRSSTESDPPAPAAAEDADWSSVHRAPANDYASSTASTGTNTTGEATNSITVSQGQFSVLSPDDYLALEGRRVLVDVSHPGLALQISQSCKQLGMQPCLCNRPADSASVNTNGGATTPQGEPQDMLVVSTDKAAAALRSGWKGRPVVAVGSRQLLTANLHPLVVIVPEPVLHARLANALVKSTVLLKWVPGSKTAGPKVTPQPISPAQLADFKSWRDRGHGASLTAALLTQQQQPQQQLRGQYVGGQLAVLNSTDGALGFSGGFMRPYAYDPLALARRSSLDNSSLDRALVQQMLATAAARASAMSSNATNGTGAAESGTNTGSSGRQPNSTALPWRSHGSGMNLPQVIPENTELQDESSSTASGAASKPTHQSNGVTSSQASGLQPGPVPQAGKAQPSPPAQQQQATSNNSKPQQQQQQQQTATPALRILIAEDNKVNQKVVLKVLQQISGGAVTDVVENGLQVLEALKKKSYDIILMDIHMPLMDGLEATRRIVATYPPNNRPRIIALSADTLQALHDRCREAGIEEFIVKPFRIEDLRRVMQSTARIQHCAPQAAAAATPQALPAAAALATAATAAVNISPSAVGNGMSSTVLAT